MAGTKGQKNRFWSEDEKRSICAQALVPGLSVAQFVLRYAMNVNLIFTWLRDPRFASDQNNVVIHKEAPDFLPIEIECAVCSSEISDAPASSEPLDVV
jgi:transposase